MLAAGRPEGPVRPRLIAKVSKIDGPLWSGVPGVRNPPCVFLSALLDVVLVSDAALGPALIVELGVRHLDIFEIVGQGDGWWSVFGHANDRVVRQRHIGQFVLEIRNVVAVEACREFDLEFRNDLALSSLSTSLGTAFS